MLSIRQQSSKESWKSPLVRWKRPVRGVLRWFVGNSSGQGLVEFALVIPFVLFLFFGVFEFGRFYFARMTMQHAVAEATRFAVTGNVLSDTLGDPMTRANSIVQVISRNARSLDVDVDRIVIDPSDGGGPGDVVRVSASFTFQFVVPGYNKLTPDGELEFRVSTAMKNEPFFNESGSSP